MATSEISEAPPVTSAASVEVNDGNNNEANDDNNNVGAANSSSNAVTPSTEQEVTLVVPRPPALPPRPPNLVLPHAGAVPRPPPAPYVMQSGKHNFAKQTDLARAPKLANFLQEPSKVLVTKKYGLAVEVFSG